MITHYWHTAITARGPRTACGLRHLALDEDATIDWLDVTCVECLTAPEEATK